MGSILILITIIFALSIEFYTWKAGVVPMPTVKRVRDEMIDMIPEKLAGEIWELGAGWGGLLFDIAQRYPNNKIVGYEISPIPYFVCKIRIGLKGYKNITLKKQNFMDHDFGNASVVLCYLTHQHMAVLEPKCRNQMKKGSVVISSTFPFPTIKLKEQITSKGLWHVNVFKYQF